MAARDRLPAGALPAALILTIAAWPDLALAVSVLPPVQARLVGPYSRFLLHALEAALERAAERLSDERCRSLLSEFSDPAGRPLSAALAGTGLAGGDYLSRLIFLDGSASIPCANPAVLAWTSPGSRAVFLCGMRFAAASSRDRELGSVILIHEGLHTLGLGENPPSSAEISGRIWRRCRG